MEGEICLRPRFHTHTKKKVGSAVGNSSASRGCSPCQGVSACSLVLLQRGLVLINVSGIGVCLGCPPASTLAGHRHRSQGRLGAVRVLPGHFQLGTQRAELRELSGVQKPCGGEH